MVSRERGDVTQEGTGTLHIPFLKLIVKEARSWEKIQNAREDNEKRDLYDPLCLVACPVVLPGHDLCNRSRAHRNLLSQGSETDDLLTPLLLMT